MHMGLFIACQTFSGLFAMVSVYSCIIHTYVISYNVLERLAINIGCNECFGSDNMCWSKCHGLHDLHYVC